MASTATLKQDTGAAAGSPAKGTSRVTPSVKAWKNVDDGSTTAAAAQIVKGNVSFELFYFFEIGGTFTELSAGLWAHTGGVMGAGLTIWGKSFSAYTTPAAVANAALDVDMTAVIDISAGQAVLFSTTGPEAAVPTTELTAAGFTNYIATQLATTVAATSGAQTNATFTVAYDES